MLRAFRFTLAIMLGWTLESNCLRKYSTPSVRVATSGCLIRSSRVPTAWNAHAKVLIEKRDACSDADEAVFLTSIIRGLERG